MATTLYPGEGDSSYGAYLPTPYPRLQTLAGNNAVPGLRTSRGTGSIATAAATVSGAGQTVAVNEFISAPLTTGITISGSITFNTRCMESSMSANIGPKVEVLKMSGATGELTSILASELGSEMSSSAETAYNWSASPTSTDFLKGDRIVVRLQFASVGNQASGYSGTFWVNGPTANASGDTYVTFTETLSFETWGVFSPSTTLHLRDITSDVSGSDVCLEMNTSEGSVTKTDISRNVGAGAITTADDTNARLQRSGTNVRWYSPPISATTLSGPSARVWLYLTSSQASNLGGYSVVLFKRTAAGVETDISRASHLSPNSDKSIQTSLNQSYLAILSFDDVSLSNGDRLGLKIYSDDSAFGTHVSADTLTLTYAGTGVWNDSYLYLRGSLSFVTPQTLTVGLIDASAAIYAPTLTQSLVIGALPLLDGAAALYAPSLALVLQILEVDLLDGAKASYAPALSIGSLKQVDVALLDAGPGAYAPTVAPAPYGLGPLDLTDANAAIYAPALASAVSDIVLDSLLTSTPVIYAPTVQADQLVTPGLLGAGWSIYSPTVRHITPVGVGLISVSPQVFALGAIYRVEPTTTVIYTPLDGRYRGGSKAVHVLTDSFAASPTGPTDQESAKYVGQAAKIGTNPGSPTQWADDTPMGPAWQVPVYRGRSKAIHVFGSAAPAFDTPEPIPSCKCCEEAGVGCSDLDDFNRTPQTDWGTATPSGEVWETPYPGGDTTFDVDGAYGNITVAAGAGGNWAQITDAAGPWLVASGFILTVRLRVSYVPANGTESVDISLYSQSGGLSLTVSNIAGEGFILLGSDEFAKSNWAQSSWYLLKWEYTGLVSRMKLWLDGTAEPDWMLTESPVTSEMGSIWYVGVDAHGTTSEVTVSFDYLNFCYSGGQVLGDCVDSNTVVQFDNFNRTTSPGDLGTADTGTDWSYVLTGAGYTVPYCDGSALVFPKEDTDYNHNGAAAQEWGPTYGTTPPWDDDSFTLRTKFRVDTVGAFQSDFQMGIYSYPDDQYRGFRIMTNNAPNWNGVWLYTATGVAVSVESIWTWLANTDYLVRWDWIKGGAHRIKIWKSSDPEPEAWTLSTTDSGTVSFHGDDTEFYVSTDMAVPGFHQTLEIDYITITNTAGCAECEDPNNPGFQLPDFTPGYLPIFRRQIGDPQTQLDAWLCNMESGAMALDWHTRGAIQVWGGDLVQHCGRSEASIVGSGTNLGDVKTAWAYYGQYLEIRSGQTWADVMTCLAQGRAVILNGDYGEFTLAERCQANYVDNHAISIYPYLISDRLLVGDPICQDFKNFKVSSLQAYAEAFGVTVFGVTSPQKIVFAVSRPWVP